MRDSTIHKLDLRDETLLSRKPDSLSSHVLIPWNEHEPPHLRRSQELLCLSAKDYLQFYITRSSKGFHCYVRLFVTEQVSLLDNRRGSFGYHFLPSGFSGLN